MNGPDLSPREAVEMYLDKRRTDATDWTIQTYHYRLKQFVEWCEREDVEEIGDLDGWAIERFETHRRADLSPVSLKGQMMALKQLLDYCENIAAVDDGLADAVDPPNLSHGQESDDTKLATDDALALLQWYRDSTANYGTVEHACLELLWHVGFRLSALRALDLQDYHPDERYLEIRHRPPETPLKNKEASERAVALTETVADVLDYYVQRERWDKRDEQGRQPLVSCRQGRPTSTTVRSWVYQATQPCLHSPCPHGHERPTCDYVSRDGASKCPSSRSPHQIRTGSITWQLNRGLPVDVVSERADVTPRVLREHYDKALQREEMEERRREYADDLDIEENDDGE